MRAGLSPVRLLEGNQLTTMISIEGYPPKADEREGPAQQSLCPGYFNALGIPLLMGRDFHQRDEGAAAPGRRTKLMTTHGISASRS